LSPSLSFANVTVGYARHPALHHLTVTFPSRSLTAVIGPNGAGKSTLLKAAVGLIRPMSGRITCHDCQQRDIAYLPQLAEVDRSFPIPVFDFVAMGQWRRRGAFSAFRRDDDEATAHALAAVGLVGFEGRTLDTLSGGQMQRVMFARLILEDAPLILLDEPFSAIDDRTIGDLMQQVERWHAEGRTIAVVLHDLALVRERFPRALLVARQCLAEGPTAEVLTEANLAAARHMTEAWDDHAPFCAGEAA
jgi:zinc/manganese transport system ATP-binding protein